MIVIYWIYIFFYSTSLGLIYLFSRLKSRDSTKKHHLNLDELVVIVPFRNEEKKIEALLTSINRQKFVPSKIILVNDHSIDNSCDLIEEYKEQKNIHLFHLPLDVYGKKEAIRYAMSIYPTTHYLTLDADVQLSDNYFESIRQTEICDMNLFPVIMKYDGAWSFLFSVEYTLFNAFNYLTAPIYVLTGSGANLLFRADKFCVADSIASHQHLSSGDDHFLIRDFQDQAFQIDVSNDWEKAVSTDGVSNICDYLIQRIRWLGKTHQLPRLKEWSLGLYLSLYWGVGFYLLLHLLLDGKLFLLLGLLIARLLLDGLIFYHYKRTLESPKTLLILLSMQFIYPILFLIILVGSFFYRPNWKDRKTH